MLLGVVRFFSYFFVVRCVGRGLLVDCCRWLIVVYVCGCLLSRVVRCVLFVVCGSLFMFVRCVMIDVRCVLVFCVCCVWSGDWYG